MPGLRGEGSDSVVSAGLHTPCPLVLAHPPLDWREVCQLLANGTHSYLVPALFWGQCLIMSFGYLEGPTSQVAQVS